MTLDQDKAALVLEHMIKNPNGITVEEAERMGVSEQELEALLLLLDSGGGAA